MILDPLDWLREVLTARDDVRSVEMAHDHIIAVTKEGQTLWISADLDNIPF